MSFFSDLSDYLCPSEKVQWWRKPDRVLFMFGGFGLGWLFMPTVFFFPVFLLMFRLLLFPSLSLNLALIFGVAAALALSLSLRFIDYHRTAHVVTDQRLVLRRGGLSGLLRGEFISSIELSEMTTVKVRGRGLYVGLPHGKGSRSLPREEGVDDGFGEWMVPVFTSLSEPQEVARRVMDAWNDYLRGHSDGSR